MMDLYYRYILNLPSIDIEFFFMVRSIQAFF